MTVSRRTTIAPSQFGTRYLDAVAPAYWPTTLSMLQYCQTQFLTQLQSGGTSGINTNKGWRWAVGSPGITFFNTIATPNSPTNTYAGCRLDCPGCGNDYGDFNIATSNHSGGVNVLMADGSVKFIKSTINQVTWWALGTKSNNEVIDASSY